MSTNIILSKFNSVQKCIAMGLLALAAVLPVQNLLVVFGVNVLGLPSWIALWKELLVVTVIGLMTYDLFVNVGFWKVKKLLFLVVFDILNILLLLSSFVFNRVPIVQFLLGYRFEVFWLWLWVIGFVWISNLHESSLHFLKKSLVKGIMIGIGICLIFTFGQLILGQAFVKFFGYTDSNTELAAGSINSPICHSIDFGVDICRLAAPFSSPNHLAGYLLFLLAFCFYNATTAGEFQKFKYSLSSFKFANFNFKDILQSRFYFLPLSVVISVLIFVTYSRYSLMPLALFWVFALFQVFQTKSAFTLAILKFFSYLVMLITFVFALLVTSFDPSWAVKVLPTFLAKPSSSIEHYRLTAVSLDILKSDPKIFANGLGQGASGSSTKYFAPDQNIIFNKYADLSYPWFIKPERISVPENWYLQLVLNGGLVYLLVYLIILLYPLWVLFKKNNSDFFQNLFVFIAFFGIIIGNIFLHLWENQTITIYWTLIYLWYFAEININKKTSK